MNNNIKKPNFFIIGAPKCGTTSLSKYLRSHPDIFFSNPKEPNYFNKDMSNRHEYLFTEKRYLKECFANSAEYKIVGEGTVMYLYSKEAVPNILKFNPKAKFIVMIRDPIEMFYSFFSMVYANSTGKIQDPKMVWDLQENRGKSCSISRNCNSPGAPRYNKICKLGEQIERLFKNVPNKKNIKIIEFKEFKNNTKKIYEEVLDFLDLESDQKTEFPVYNKSYELKSKKIVEVRRFLGQTKLNAYVKKMLGIWCWSFTEKIHQWNIKEIKKKPLNKEFKKELRNYFKEDVKKLSKITNKDLSHWLK